MTELSKTDYCLLIDYYGDLLTDYQQEVLRQYYECDMSYSEVADVFEITRQGARDVIARASAKILDIENKLHFVAKIGEYEKLIDRLIDTTVSEEFKQELIELKRKVREI